MAGAPPAPAPPVPDGLGANLCVQETDEGSKDWRAHGPSEPASLETLPEVLASPWSCWLNPHLMKSPKFHPQQEGSGVLRLFVYFC